MPSGPDIILYLKMAVALATLLLICSLMALLNKQPRWHGRINKLVAAVLLTAVIAFEVMIRLLGVDVLSHMDETARLALKIHLCFVIPLVPFLLMMLFTGMGRRIRVHLWL